VISNARTEAGIINPESNTFLELDVYVPSHNLAFEFQVFPLPPPPLSQCISLAETRFSSRRNNTTMELPNMYINHLNKFNNETA